MTMWKPIETFDYKKYLYVDVIVRGQDGVAVAAWDDDEKAFIADLRGKGNGQIVYGHDGFAGELGHTIIIPDGRLHWGTGAHGSLEAYASATGIRLTALELLEKHHNKTSLLRNVPVEELESYHVHECALQGDEIAIEVFEYTGKVLGMALANFVMFSSPEAIVLFGGPTKSGDLIMKPVRKYMEENLLPIFRNKVKLIFSLLKESDAAILGASALVWEKK